jgi:hypothetical protein
VTAGSNVTLRSLFPDTTVTTRVSGFQPVLGTDTTTVCVPIVRLSDIGVVLPVSMPSITTLAPEGYEVTFNEPFCAKAWPVAAKNSVSTAMATLGILITETPFHRRLRARPWTRAHGPDAILLSCKLSFIVFARTGCQRLFGFFEV